MLKRLLPVLVAALPCLAGEAVPASSGVTVRTSATAPCRSLNDTVSVLTWKHGARSAVSLTFDDGTKDHRTYVEPILKAHGFRGTFFVITGALDNPGGNSGTWDDMLQLGAAGHEIASHTVMHPRLTPLSDGSDATPGTRRHELGQSKTIVEAKTQKPCITMAYPYCDRNAAVDALTSTYYRAARNGGVDAVHPVWNASSAPTWMNLASYIPSFPKVRTSTQSDEATLAHTKASLAAAVPQQGWAILMSHMVVPFSQVATVGGFETQSTEWFGAVCDWLEAQQRQGDMWIDTMGNVTRYIHERDAVRLEGWSASSKEIRFKLVDGLDGKIFDHPLSVSVKIPATWKHVKVQQAGATATASAKLPGVAGQSIELQAKPNAGWIRVSKR